jgi:hypothetical protein
MSARENDENETDKTHENHSLIDSTFRLPDAASERANPMDVSEFPRSLPTLKHGKIQPESNLKPSVPPPTIVWHKLMLEQ